MAEFYKTLKLIHNSIIISCVALILISLPDLAESNPYKDGVEELKTIRKAYKEIREYEVKIIKDQHQDQIKKITEIFAGTPFIPIFKNELYGVPHSVWNIEYLYRRIILPDSIYWTSSYVQAIDFDIESSIDTVELKEWYINNKDSIHFDGWSFTNAIENYAGISLSKGGILKSKNPFGFKPNGISNIPNHKKNIKKILEKNKILYVTNDTIKAFKRLKNDLFWEQIRGLKLEKAEPWLIAETKKEKTSQAKPLSIFGFSIPFIYASTIGPLIIITLLAFMLTHLVEFSKFVTENPKEKITYPWIGIYNHCLGRSFFVSTIIILPVVGCFLVINFSDPKPCIFGIISIFLIVIIGYGILKATSTIISKKTK